MNLSVTALRVTQFIQSSPFITDAGKRNIFVNNGYFSKFSSPFMDKFTLEILPSKISSSKFDHFMKSVVKIDSESIVANKYSTTFKPDDKDKIITFHKCIFDHCSNPEFGGAIYIKDTAYQMNITGTSFSYCTSGKDGGAIYSIINNTKLKRVSFSKCNTGLSCSYQTFLIHLVGQGESENIQISDNGDSVEKDSFVTFNMKRGNTINKQYNVTNNVVYSYGAALTSTLSKNSSFVMMYSNFINNRCQERELFSFYHGNRDCSLKFSNIVKNSGGIQSLLITSVGNCHVTVYGCVIIKNNVATLSIINDLNLILFERCAVDMEQVPPRTVHHIECTFKQEDFPTIQIVK